MTPFSQFILVSIFFYDTFTLKSKLCVIFYVHRTFNRKIHVYIHTYCYLNIFLITILRSNPLVTFRQFRGGGSYPFLISHPLSQVVTFVWYPLPYRDVTFFKLLFRANFDIYMLSIISWNKDINPPRSCLYFKLLQVKGKI